MTSHSTASREQWLEARLDLLAAEKDLTRRSDQVAQLRRQLPWVKIDKRYLFDGPRGRIALDALFENRHQLLVQHFMFAPGREHGCANCSYMADHVDGMTIHLANRDVTFVAVSRAPLVEIERFRRRMGWQFTWVSSCDTDFNYDYGVSFTPDEVEKGKIDYNYGNWPFVGEEWPGISVFCKNEAGEIFHTYSTYGRGVEVMMGTYRMLDLTPKGRGEPNDTVNKMAWIRHHDSYERTPAQMGPSAETPCCEAHSQGGMS